MDPEIIKSLVRYIKKDGIFIFNTFNTCPTREPMVKEYEIDSVSFVEISYLVGDNDIHHVQVREGYPPHLTEFKWMSEEYFKNCLDKYFKIDIIRNNRTDVYKCVRK